MSNRWAAGWGRSLGAKVRSSCNASQVRAGTAPWGQWSENRAAAVPNCPRRRGGPRFRCRRRSCDEHPSSRSSFATNLLWKAPAAGIAAAAVTRFQDIAYFGNCSSRVSRPIRTATRLSTAKHVMTAQARLKLPPKVPARRPATNGPKLVMMRPVPLQNDKDVART